MMVDDIAAYLMDQGLGERGNDIFEERMPHEPDECVVLYSYGGNPPEHIGGIEYPGLQVKVRGEDHSTALDKINDVMNALHTMSETTIGGRRYLYAYATQSPAYAGLDQRKHPGLPIYVLNFIVVKEME